MLFCGIISPVERQPPTTKTIPTKWGSLTNNEPIRGSIMSNAVYNFLTELNVRLDEQFTLSDVEAFSLSIFSQKSNLLIKFKFLEQRISKRYVLQLLQFIQTSAGHCQFNVIGNLEKDSPISIDDVVSIIKRYLGVAV